MSDLAYLDYCASAPLRPQARQAMEQALAEVGPIGLNPSSLHTAGRAARELLEAARSQIAQLVGAESSEVVFTSGGSESDALALRGLGEVNQDVLISAIEHPAVTKNAQQRTQNYATNLWTLPVTDQAVADLEALHGGLIGPEAGGEIDFSNLAVASLMWVNNEVGTIQPVTAFAQAIKKLSPQALVHSDAIQAGGRIPLDFKNSGLDAMSLAAHKFGGPAGVGALVLRKGLGLRTDRLGGGQERQIRSGTQNVLGAVGMAAALKQAVENQAAEAKQEAAWREKILRVAALHGVKVTAPNAQTVPAIVHLWVEGATSEGMLLAFDLAKVCVSAGSACHAGVARPSAVMLAMGFDQPQAMGSLRISFGHATTDADVEAFCQALPQAIQAGRALGSR